MDLPDRLRRCLSTRARIELVESEAVCCAVLVPLVRDGDGYRVLYTLRSEALPNHRGQVAFPGGKQHVEDPSLLETALREAHEEVGITPADVTVLGRLDDVHTILPKYVVTPYVGVLPAGYGFRANPAEVADLFTVALSDLGDPTFQEIEQRTMRGTPFDVETITAGPHVIWGVTHKITKNLLDCIEDAKTIP